MGSSTGPIGPGERRPRPESGRGGLVPADSGPGRGPPVHAALPNGTGRTIWASLARDWASRDDCAGSPAQRTVGSEGEMARRAAAQGRTRGDGKQVRPWACQTRTRLRMKLSPGEQASRGRLPGSAGILPRAHAWAHPWAHAWKGHVERSCSGRFHPLGSAAGSAGGAMARRSRRHEPLAGWKHYFLGARAPMEHPITH